MGSKGDRRPSTEGPRGPYATTAASPTLEGSDDDGDDDGDDGGNWDDVFAASPAEDQLHVDSAMEATPPSSNEASRRLADETDLRFGAALADELRAAIKAELGYTCCAGIGANKTVAKVAGELHKPDQQTCVLPEAHELVLQHRQLRQVGGLGGRDAARTMPCAALSHPCPLSPCAFLFPLASRPRFLALDVPCGRSSWPTTTHR